MTYGTKGFRRLTCACFGLLALSAIAPRAAAAPVYACVEISRNALVNLKILTEGTTCASGYTRMLLVISKSLLFNATASAPVSERGPLFEAKVLPIELSLTSSAPLFIAVTLDINTDKGMFTIPVAAATAAGVSCVPIVDGLAAGQAQALTTNPPPSTPALRVTTTAAAAPGWPGNFPDTRWSILRQYTGAAAGKHPIGLECAAGSAFHFRGLGTVVVLQPITGN